MFVTHSVFESVFLSQRIAVMSAPAGPRALRTRHSGALSTHRSLRDLRRLRGPLPPRLGATLGRHGSGADGPVRRADPDRAWSLPPYGKILVRAMAIPSYVSAGPDRGREALVTDLVDAVAGAGRHLAHHRAGAAGGGALVGVLLALLFSAVALD